MKFSHKFLKAQQLVLNVMLGNMLYVFVQTVFLN